MRKLVVIWISLVVSSVYVLYVFSQEVGPSTVGRAQPQPPPRKQLTDAFYVLNDPTKYEYTICPNN